MSYSFNGTSDYAERASFPLPSPPFSVAIWFKPPTDSINNGFVGFWDPSRTDRYHQVGFLASFLTKRPYIATRNPFENFGNEIGAQAAAGATQGAWNSTVAVWAGIANRTVYLDGGNAASNTTDSASPTSITRLGLGASAGSARSYRQGLYAYLGIWGVALTATDAASYHGGTLPEQANLIAWYPLQADADDATANALHLTVSGASVSADNPSVSYVLGVAPWPGYDNAYAGPTSGPQTFTLNLSDTLALTDAIAKKASIVPADSMGLADAMANRPKLAIADTVSLVDAITKSVGKQLADTLALADAIAKGIVMGLAEAMAMSDSIDFGQPGQTLTLNLSDTISLSDSLGKALGLALADQIALADAVAKRPGKNLADTMALAEAVSKRVALTLGDTMPLPDAIAKRVAVQIVDSMGLSDEAVAMIAGQVTAGLFERMRRGYGQ